MRITKTQMVGTMIFILSFATRAAACTSFSVDAPPVSRDAYFKSTFSAAKAVFRARVTGVTRTSISDPTVPNKTRPIVEATYTVVEIFKGPVPSKARSWDGPYGIGACSIEFVPTMEYVLYVDSRGMVSGTDSFGFKPAQAEEVKSRIDDVRRLSAAMSRR